MLTNHPPKSPITLPQSFITSFSHSPPIFSLFSCSHCTDRRFSHAFFDRISHKLRVLFPSFRPSFWALGHPFWSSSCEDIEFFVILRGWGEISFYWEYQGLSLLAPLAIYHHSVALSITPIRFLIGPALVALHHTPSSSPIALLRIFHSHQPISHQNPIDPIPVLTPSSVAIHCAHPFPDPPSRLSTIRVLVALSLYHTYFAIFLISFYHFIAPPSTLYPFWPHLSPLSIRPIRSLIRPLYP